MKGHELKSLIEAKGIRTAYTLLQENLDKGDIKPEDISFADLWEHLVGPLSVTLPQVKRQRGFIMPLHEQAINSTNFEVITGQLISQKMIEGYAHPAFIGDMLTRNMPSRLRTETITGMTALLATPLEVKEGGEYKEAEGMKEKYVTTETAKKGRILSVTEEAIFFDQTGQILKRAEEIGYEIGYEREVLILNAVLGQNNNAYKPAGVATAIYSSGNKNLKTGNTLVDWTDIDAARQQFKQMVDENGKKILVMGTTLLVPSALEATALNIVNATSIVTKTDSSKTETNSANPLRAGYTVLSSILIDDVSTVNWYLGDFNKQFNWQEIWPLQIFRRNGQETEDGFRRDVVAQFKSRYYGGVFADDTRRVVKNTA